MAPAIIAARIAWRPADIACSFGPHRAEILGRLLNGVFLLIIVTALVIRSTGFLPFDPLLGMGFGLVLAYVCWGIMREALAIVIEGAPADVDLAEVMARLQVMPGLRDVHHVRARTLTSDRHVFSARQIESHCLDESRAQHLDITRGTPARRTQTGTHPS